MGNCLGSSTTKQQSRPETDSSKPSGGSGAGEGEGEGSKGTGMDIKGSVAIVTGAARGLGRAFTETLLARGAKVCVADVDSEQGQATVSELQASHGADNVIFSSCNVTSDDEFKATWDKTVEKLGTVNLLINNAGIGNEQKWEKTIQVNLGGSMRGTLLALERMGINKGGAGGTVVNISSIVGLKSNPFGPVYSASKHGIIGLTRSLGTDFHMKVSGVKVQALCPSLVKTDLLTNSLQNAFSPEVSQAMAKFASNLPTMTAESVSGALVKLLEEGRHGGCLVVEAGKEPYYVEAPLS